MVGIHIGVLTGVMDVELKSMFCINGSMVRMQNQMMKATEAVRVANRNQRPNATGRRSTMMVTSICCPILDMRASPKNTMAAMR